MVRYVVLAASLGLATVLSGCAGRGGTGAQGLPLSPSPVSTRRPMVTRTITGTVKDEDDGLLAGVALTAPDGTRSISDANGSFRLVYEAPEQAGGVVLCEKDGYESVRAGLTRDIDVTIRPRMARSVILTDTSQTAELLPPLFGYYVGEEYDSDFCTPCRRIRLRTSTPGQVRVTVRWAGPSAVHAWAADGMITATPDSQSLTIDVPVTSEAVAYVGIPYTRGGEPVTTPLPLDITTAVLGR